MTFVKEVAFVPYATVNGVKIYYELLGKGQTVVFLNGILANTQSWMNQAPFFSKKFRVLLLDFRGQGNSEKPVMKYAMETHADDVKALIEHLGLTKIQMV